MFVDSDLSDVTPSVKAQITHRSSEMKSKQARNRGMHFAIKLSFACENSLIFLVVSIRLGDPPYFWYRLYLSGNRLNNI